MSTERTRRGSPSLTTTTTSVLLSGKRRADNDEAEEEETTMTRRRTMDEDDEEEIPQQTEKIKNGMPRTRKRITSGGEEEGRARISSCSSSLPSSPPPAHSYYGDSSSSPNTGGPRPLHPNVSSFLLHNNIPTLFPAIRPRSPSITASSANDNAIVNTAGSPASTNPTWGLTVNAAPPGGVALGDVEQHILLLGKTAKENSGVLAAAPQASPPLPCSLLSYDRRLRHSSPSSSSSSSSSRHLPSPRRSSSTMAAGTSSSALLRTRMASSSPPISPVLPSAALVLAATPSTRRISSTNSSKSLTSSSLPPYSSLAGLHHTSNFQQHPPSHYHGRPRINNNNHHHHPAILQQARQLEVLQQILLQKPSFTARQQQHVINTPPFFHNQHYSSSSLAGRGGTPPPATADWATTSTPSTNHSISMSGRTTGVTNFHNSFLVNHYPLPNNQHHQHHGGGRIQHGINAASNNGAVLNHLVAVQLFKQQQEREKITAEEILKRESAIVTDCLLMQQINQLMKTNAALYDTLLKHEQQQNSERGEPQHPPRQESITQFTSSLLPPKKGGEIAGLGSLGLEARRREEEVQRKEAFTRSSKKSSSLLPELQPPPRGAVCAIGNSYSSSQSNRANIGKETKITNADTNLSPLILHAKCLAKKQEEMRENKNAVNSSSAPSNNDGEEAVIIGIGDSPRTYSLNKQGKKRKELSDNIVGHKMLLPGVVPKKKGKKTIMNGTIRRPQQKRCMKPKKQHGSATTIMPTTKSSTPQTSTSSSLEIIKKKQLINDDLDLGGHGLIFLLTDDTSITDRKKSKTDISDLSILTESAASSLYKYCQQIPGVKESQRNQSSIKTKPSCYKARGNFNDVSVNLGNHQSPAAAAAALDIANVLFWGSDNKKKLHVLSLIEVEDSLHATGIRDTKVLAVYFQDKFSEEKKTEFEKIVLTALSSIGGHDDEIANILCSIESKKEKDKNHQKMIPQKRSKKSQKSNDCLLYPGEHVIYEVDDRGLYHLRKF